MKLQGWCTYYGRRVLRHVPLIPDQHYATLLSILADHTHRRSRLATSLVINVILYIDSAMSVTRNVRS
jgi:hypothetical protein